MGRHLSTIWKQKPSAHTAFLHGSFPFLSMPICTFLTLSLPLPVSLHAGLLWTQRKSGLFQLSSPVTTQEQYVSVSGVHGCRGSTELYRPHQDFCCFSAMSGGLSKHCFPSAAELSQSKDSLLPHVGTSKTPARSFKTPARGKHGNLRASQEFPSSTDCTCSGLSPSRAQETNKQKQLRSTPLISAKCQSFSGMIPN